MLKIVTVPNKILTIPSKRIKKIDGEIKKLAQGMIKILRKKRNPKGAGLSAPQVGKLIRLFVIFLGEKPEVFINPKIIWRSKKTLKDVLKQKEYYLEGCLSIPGYYGFVNRPYQVKLSYRGLNDRKKTAKFKGLDASYVQHEYDHLNGILFTQRVLEQEGNLYKIEKDKEGKESLIEIEI